MSTISTTVPPAPATRPSPPSSGWGTSPAAAERSGRRGIRIDFRDGGINHISCRPLLCGPCNLAKSNTLSLSDLRHINRGNGWKVKE